MPWQRSQFHLCQNAQDYAPKKAMKAEIGETTREILNSQTHEIALEMKRHAMTKYQKRAIIQELTKNQKKIFELGSVLVPNNPMGI